MLHLSAPHVSLEFYLEYLINHPLNISQLMYMAVVLSQCWKVHKSVLLHIIPAQWALKKNKREAREGKGSSWQPWHDTAPGVAWRQVWRVIKQGVCTKTWSPGSFLNADAGKGVICEQKAATHTRAGHCFDQAQEEAVELGRKGVDFSKVIGSNFHWTFN